ncbi:hypothetical protein B0H19DRAFT_1237646 [Mycena capillaripes]|nr:hypothetical protein B0H19DRAFT_1237646 [Mycena capillaripes]
MSPPWVAEVAGGDFNRRRVEKQQDNMEPRVRDKTNGKTHDYCGLGDRSCWRRRCIYQFRPGIENVLSSSLLVEQASKRMKGHLSDMKASKRFQKFETHLGEVQAVKLFSDLKANCSGAFLVGRLHRLSDWEQVFEARNDLVYGQSFFGCHRRMSCEEGDDCG